MNSLLNEHTPEMQAVHVRLKILNANVGFNRAMRAMVHCIPTFCTLAQPAQPGGIWSSVYHRALVTVVSQQRVGWKWAVSPWVCARWIVGRYRTGRHDAGVNTWKRSLPTNPQYIQTNTSDAQLSNNAPFGSHNPVTWDNPQSLLWAVSWRKCLLPVSLGRRKRIT